MVAYICPHVICDMPMYGGYLMKSLFRNLALSLVFAFGASTAIAAVITVEDLTERVDIIPSTTYSFDLGDVDNSAPASVTGLLALWNSNGSISGLPILMTVELVVNGTVADTIDLLPVPGFSDPVNSDVSGLLVDGVNAFTFSILTDFSDGAPATFASKGFRLNYSPALAAVPLPATGLLLVAALGLMGLRRRLS